MRTQITNMENSFALFHENGGRDLTEVPTRLLPSDFPTLLIPTRDAMSPWTTSTEVVVEKPSRRSHSIFFPEMKIFCQTVDHRVYLWNTEHPDQKPTTFCFESDILAVGLLHRKHIHNILVFSIGKKLEICVAYLHPTATHLQFQHVSYVECLCPDGVSSIAGVGEGIALIGTQNGSFYQLKISVHGEWYLNGINYKIERVVSWDWKQYFKKVAPVKKIHIDEKRNLAYALHTDSELNVFCLNPGAFSNKPVRIANYLPSEGLDLSSVHALPGTDFNNCVLLGCSTQGHCLFYYLEPGVSGEWKLMERNFPKKAKTYWGFGLQKNLVLKHKNSSILAHFSGYLTAGFKVSIASVVDSTIVLSLYDPGTNQSYLAEVKMVSKGHQDVSILESKVFTGKVEGIEVIKTSKGMKSDSKKARDQEELTQQVFCMSTDLVVYTSSHFLKMKKRRPYDVLLQIMDLKKEGFLEKFMEAYTPAETVYMLLLSRACNEDAWGVLLQHQNLLGSLLDGFNVLLMRLLSPIWNTEVFRLEPSQSLLFGKDKIYVHLPESDLKFYIKYFEALEKVVMEFLQLAEVAVYNDGSVYSPRSGTLSPEQARQIKELEDFINHLRQLMMLVQYLKTLRDFSLRKARKKEVLLKVTVMSFRDFACFGLYEHSEFAEFLEEVKEQLEEKERISFLNFLQKQTPYFLQTPPREETPPPARQTPGPPESLRQSVDRLNERLNQVEGSRVSTRKRKLDDHYAEVFKEFIDLINKFQDVGSTPAFTTDFSSFIDVVKKIDSEEVQISLYDRVINSCLATPCILSLDPVFEQHLKINLKQVLGKQRRVLVLNQKQIRSLEVLKELYKSKNDCLKAAELYITLAIRNEQAKSGTISLKQRVLQLEKAVSCLQSHNKKEDADSIQRVIEWIGLQQEIILAVRNRMEGLEVVEDDKELLIALESRIASLTEMQDLVEIALMTNDDQTRQAFEKSRFQNAAEILRELKSYD